MIVKYVSLDFNSQANFLVLPDYNNNYILNPYNIIILYVL